MKKAALITGGAKRLGREIALTLARAGYDIALHYHTSESEARILQQEIETLGRQCFLIEADLSEPRTYELVVAYAHDKLPHLNLLVNNASVFERGSLRAGNMEHSARQFRLNFEAPVFLAQEYVKRVGHGAIVNMLDTQITAYQHSFGFYLLSKKALAEYTKMAAVEFGPQVRVNGVCPGYILPAHEFNDEYRDKLKDRLPMKKIATPQDIADAVLVLAENQSLTGQFLFIDGGESLI